MAEAVTESLAQSFAGRLVKIIQNPDKDDFKHPGYRQAVDHADEMAVHLYGDKPDDLLKRVRPREDPDITAYRLESYEPTTKSTADKGVSLCNKIFNPNLYAIKAKDGDSAQLLYKYATVEYPVFNSVVNYLSSFGLRKALADPNAVFVVEPGNLTSDVTVRITPVVNCYSSKDVWIIDDNIVIIYLYEQKDEQGTITYFFKSVDKQNITEFSLYINSAKEWIYSELSNYPHLFGTIPAWLLGGSYNQKTTVKYGAVFESFFYPAVPFWNKAICAESDLDGAFISHIHPQKWEVADECEFVEVKEYGEFSCQSGYIYDPKTRGGKHLCPQCGGLGRKSVKSPYQTYQVAKDKLNDPNGASLNQPPAGYIDVPTTATQMLVDRAKLLHEQGLSALNMDIVNKIGNNQSGEAKAYDRTELFDFLGKVRDLFYDKHLVNIFYYFAKYMFIGNSDEQIDKIEPEIIKPNNFDIYTTQELTDQLKIAKESTINPSYIGVKQIEVQNKEFQTHPEMLKFLNLVVALDPYVGTPRADVDLMLFGKTASKISIIIHDNINAFVKRALEEDPSFGDKDYSDQMETLKSFAQEMSEAIEEESKIEIDLNAVEPDPAKPPVPVNE